MFDMFNILLFLAAILSAEDDFFTTFFSFNWQATGTYKLEHSHSTITLPEGYRILIGEEARKMRELLKIPREESLEAAVLTSSLNSSILFYHYKDGYVPLHDWKEINAEELLKKMREFSENENRRRRGNGLDLLHLVGWIQKPSLNRETQTVHWVVEYEVEDLQGNINPINAVDSYAIKLSREGYETIVWFTDKVLYLNYPNHLDAILQSYSFDPGFRYEDYVSGDKIANYTVAALVATSVGAKIAKVTGVFVLLKKIGGFIFAAIAALFYKGMHLFRRKEKPVNERKAFY